MGELRMGAVESRFADLIWGNEPISSGALAKLAEEKLQWKKTTSFTVLKRLCDRGLFENNAGTVTSRMSREEYYARHSEQYVQETFGGSLPAFLTAFSSRKKLTEREVEELQRLIETMRR
ncbi:MAG: BlaI/MecI/CopY family transcriptional regulator [Oscillospiraceae bacterium]|nr:BlaI/MecI/CopY family transcriptional regulator [Oscillospiraceae bacterium]